MYLKYNIRIEINDENEDTQELILLNEIGFMRRMF